VLEGQLDTFTSCCVCRESEVIASRRGIASIVGPGGLEIPVCPLYEFRRTGSRTLRTAARQVLPNMIRSGQSLLAIR
jgi:hypothetical protein